MALDREKLRWLVAACAAMAAAYTIASIVEREDTATIILGGVATVVFAGLWYFAGRLVDRS